MARPDTVARLLTQIEEGHPGAFDELFAEVYHELRLIARSERRMGPARETLNTTALVHEAYLKLAASSDPGWSSRAHFLAATAKAIRHLLLNYARDQQARKRGGGWRRISVEVERLAGAEPSDRPLEELIALDEALHRLRQRSKRLSRVVECRCFGGMTIEETAQALDVSTATVTRDLATAQAWLYRELSGDGGGPAS